MSSVKGIVSDENKVPVPGAEVSLKDSAGISHSTFTDTLGRFEFPTIPAGQAQITLSKPGFFRLENKPIELKSGDNEIQFAFPHEQEVHEKVDVLSSTQRIDPTSTQQSTTLVAHDILNAPVSASHVLSSYLVTMPGVVMDNSGQLHFAGARVDQTEYLLDGFEISDPSTGQLNFRESVDSVRLADLETSRYGAEYAHAGAGVLGLETISGDDKFRFNATNFIPAPTISSGVHFGNWYPRFGVSGPIVKGRAWFSESVSIQHTLTVLSGLPAGQNLVEQWDGDNLLRVGVRLTSRQTLFGNFLYNMNADSHIGLTPFNPDPATVNISGHGFFLSAKDQFQFASSLLEFGIAGDTGTIHSAPLGTMPFVIMPTGNSGNYFANLDSRPRRLQGLTNYFLPARHWHGTHDITFGANADDIYWQQTAIRTQIEALRADGTLDRLSTFTGPSALHLSDMRAGVYAQDSWQVVRYLRIQAGLRADWDRLAQEAIVQPRIAVNIIPFPDDRTKISVGWGEYFQPLDFTLIGQALGQMQVDVPYDPTGTIPLVAQTVTSQFLLPAGHLRLPYFYNASAEWQQRIAKSTFLNFSFLDREGRDGLAFQNLDPGLPLQSFLLGNQRRDTYRAGEAGVRHQFSDQAEIGVDYIRSSSRTNQALDFALGSIFYAPQAAGPLPWDAPNRIVAHGWAPLPLWRLFGSYFLEYHSGFPFNVVNQEQQLAGPLGSNTFPAYVSLNLGLEKRFHFFHHNEWALRLAVINTTGHQNANAVINNVDAPNFLTFAGGEKRAFTFRLRLVGNK
ncbi:MAG: carboxypeptidase regulatory-like domain-containing protein [Candidatus Acidiferrales bacterium]